MGQVHLVSTNQIREQAKSWRFFLTRKTVIGLCADLDAAEAQLTVCRQGFAQAEARCEMLAEALEELKGKHEQAKEGTSVLLGFIRQAHRLGSPITPGSAREVLAK